MTEDAGYVLQLLKELDQEKYLATLYLPKSLRRDAVTLWAFNAEISRIPELVSEPALGEIRLQWWQDLIGSGESSDSGPLARELIGTISRNDLPSEKIQTYLEARIFDLYHDPMPDTGTFEGYLGETVSLWFHYVAVCGGATQTTELADACGHAGMAVGTSWLLSQARKHRSRGQTYFPADMLAEFGLDREGWLSQPDDRHRKVVSAMTNEAGTHLSKARKAINRLPKNLHSVFLPLAAVEPVLNKIEKTGGTCLEQPQALSSLARQWNFFRAALRGAP